MISIVINALIVVYIIKYYIFKAVPIDCIKIMLFN